MERLEKFGEKLKRFLGREELRGIGERAVRFKNKEEERRFFREAEEEEERLVKEEEKRKREREEEERKKRLEAKEREELERDFLRGMDEYRLGKFGVAEESDGKLRKVGDGVIHRERVQEVSERAFNEALTPMEEIEAYAASGDERVSEREVEVEGEKVKVYDLKGLPIRFLAHAIDFKGNGEETNRIGGVMAGRLQRDPSLWMRKKGEVEPNPQDGDSDCISLSYIDSEVNMLRLSSGGRYFNLKYGFDHVLPDSILQVRAYDGATVRNIGEAKTFLRSSDVYMPEELAERTDLYNEVQIRRFDEEGKPRKPDFMVVNDGRGMETILKHAAYFKVPVINIETRAYAREEVRRFLGEIEEIQRGEASYEQIRKLYERIEASTAVSGEKKTNGLGYGAEVRVSTSLGGEANEKIKEFLEYEKERRTEEVRKKLAEGAKKLREGAREGKGAFSIETDIMGVQRFTGGVDYAEENPDKVMIEFRLGDGLVRKTEFYDGDGRGYETYGGMKVEGTSRYYKRVLPEVEEYLDALIEADGGRRGSYWAELEMKRREGVQKLGKT